MKNLKMITLLWIILIAWTLSGCFWDKDSDNENPNNIENMVQEDSPIAIYYNELIDIAAQCFNTEQAISDTYNDQSSSIIDVQFAISKTLNQCLDASAEIQRREGREWDFTLNNWLINVLEKTVDYYSKFSEFISYKENDTTTEETDSIEEIENYTEESEESINEESINTLTNLSNELDILKEELDTATSELKLIQEEFASVYWLTLKN